MKNIILFIVITSLFIGEVKNQIICGFAEKYFASFDLTERIPDTLLTFTGEPYINLDFGAAIDRYNGRYFFGGYIPGQSGNFHIITLGENSIESFNNNPQNIEYDFIRNRLIYEYNGDFYSIDLTTMSTSFIGEIENWNNNIYGQIRTYIPQTNQYCYLKYNNPYYGDPYFLLVNANTAEINCHVMVEEYNGIHYCPSGLVTNNYSGEIIGHRNGRYGIVSPCEGKTSKLSEISDYNGLLNNQMAVFNHNDSTYIIPYYSSNSSDHYKYAIVDVYQDLVIETFSQPWPGEMNLQQIYDKPMAPIIYFNDTLFVPFGNNYKWYRNDAFIGETNVNSWKPEISGYYKAEIEFREYTTFSKEIYIQFTSNFSIDVNNNLIIFPNPARDYINISIKKHSFINIQMFNVTGKVVFKKAYESANFENINISDFESGIYSLQIMTDKELFVKKIIIE